MKHLHSKIDPTIRPLAGIFLAYLNIALQILVNFRQFPDTITRAIVSTPGLYLMVADMWIWQCNRDSTDTQPLDCYATLTLLLPLFSHNAIGTKDFVNSSPENLKKISIAVLKMVRLSAKDELRWVTVFFQLLFLVNLLTTISRPLYHVRLSQNSIIEVCHALAFYSSSRPPESAAHLPTFRSCIASCFKYLSPAILRTDGFTWIHQTVSSGLISSLLRCAQREFDKVTEEAVAMLNCS
jgi:hypothetical protein